MIIRYYEKHIVLIAENQAEKFQLDQTYHNMKMEKVDYDVEFRNRSSKTCLIIEVMR